VNFRPELAQAILDGRKTVTRRLVSDKPRSPWFRERCTLKVDHSYAVCPGRGKPAIGRVRVVSTHLERLGDVFGETAAPDDNPPDSMREAIAEGFTESVQAFKETWTAINGGYDPEALVWRVEFTLENERRER
jgi:hypothetical protein